MWILELRKHPDIKGNFNWEEVLEDAGRGEDVEKVHYVRATLDDDNSLESHENCHREFDQARYFRKLASPIALKLGGSVSQEEDWTEVKRTLEDHVQNFSKEALETIPEKMFDREEGKKFLEKSRDWADEKKDMKPPRGWTLDKREAETSWARKDLRGADLSGAQLQLVSLSQARLLGANLELAALECACLRHADLRGASLERAKLNRAWCRHGRLEGAHMYETELCGAFLKQANLRWARLWRAKLKGALLHRADLSWSVMHTADLTHADLRVAILTGAIMKNATLINAQLDGVYWEHGKPPIVDGVNCGVLTKPVPTKTVPWLDSSARDGCQFSCRSSV